MKGYEPLGSANQYDLRLPPVAPVQPGDGLAAELLARPEVRDSLQDVNNNITGQYEELTQAGNVVHELFRGATPDGIGVAVAEYTSASAAEGVDPDAYQQRYPIFRDGQYIVYGYRLDELLTDQGVGLATTPRQLVDMEQPREGVKVLGVVVAGGGTTTVAVPLRGYNSPTIGGSRVIGFREAAFGERRVEAARESLNWLAQIEWDTTRALRQAGREGDTAKAEVLGARAGQISEYYAQRLDELYSHPEWIDTPPEDVLPGFEGYLQAHPELLPYAGANSTDQANSMRQNARGYVRELCIIDPDELDVIAAAMMPEQPRTGATDWSSYYMDGAGVDGRRAAIVGAIGTYRKGKLDEVLGEQ